MTSLYIGALARFAVTFVAARGVTLTEDSALQILYGAAAVGSLLWSLWQKHQAANKGR
jgi:hypothetical protein